MHILPLNLKLKNGVDEEGCCGPVLRDANRNEGSDAAANVNTSDAMDIGDTMDGTISSAADQDFYEINLVAGQSYTFTVWGTGGLNNGLEDTTLGLRNSSGSLITFNDDTDQTSFFSGIQYTATSTGTYYLDVGGYSFETGDYTLMASRDVWSVDQVATWMTEASWSFPTTIRYDASPGDVITVNLTGLSVGAELARTALEAWSDYTGLRFREVVAAADMDFTEAGTVATAFAGPTSFNPVNGLINSSDVTVTRGWISEYGSTLDSYSFLTYMHEIGHALGLGHAGPYDGNATYGFDDLYRNDSEQMSIMSYFDESNTVINMTDVDIVTPMIADIAAMERLYGSFNAHTGNTVWGSGSNVGGYLEDIFDEYFDGINRSNYTGGAIGFTVKDDGGNDLLDFSTTSLDQRIDMREGGVSDIMGEQGNVVIALDTVIERATSGGGNDDLIGNNASNRIIAGSGRDTILGNAGNDTISGDAGNDIISGGAGNDVMLGGAGNDVFVDLTGADAFLGGAGTDRVSYFSRSTGVEVNLTPGASNGGDTYSSIEQVWGSNTGADTLTGSGANNALLGFGGNDRLEGSFGNDVMDGGAGNDLLVDLFGSNTFIGGSGQDLVSYFSRGGNLFLNLQTGINNGGDTFSSIENIWGSNTGNDLIFGDGVANALRGLGGNDTISGGGGNDTVLGDAGNDRLEGSFGNDVLNGGAGNDLFIDFFGSNTFVGGSGQDLVSYFSRGGNLSLNLQTGFNNGGDTFSSIENIWGTNTGSDLIVGNGAANALRGLGGNDTISGGAGNDTVLGDGGNDRLEGSFGNDVLNGGADHDLFIDLFGSNTFIGGSGQDLVSYFSRGGNLFLNLQTGFNNGGDTFSSIEHIWGTNTGNDIIFGNGAANELRGLGGNDTISGGGGNDTVLGDAGNDRLEGSIGNDVLNGGAGNDLFIDFFGSNTFVGGSGQDLVSYFSRGGNILLNLETGFNNGGDTFSSIENIWGTNTGGDVIIGNGVANALRGLGGNDTISGGGGNDTVLGDAGNDRLEGNLGNDVLNGGTGNDLFIDLLGSNTFIGGSGQDTVSYFGLGGDVQVDLQTGANNAGDTFSGIEHVWGSNLGEDTLTGNNSNNLLIGFGGNDRLTGGAGNDALQGVGGNDVLVGGTGNDALSGGAGLDRFVFDFGDGNDVVRDFVIGDDIIDLTAALIPNFLDLTITDVAGDALVEYSATDSILLENVDAAVLSASDFELM